MTQNNDMSNFDEYMDMPMPEDGIKWTGDVAGYWDPEKSAIRCIPRSVKLFDAQLNGKLVNPPRPNALILAELTHACPIKVKDNDGNWSYVAGKVGDTVGIWYKPGMRGIVDKAGIDCYVKDSGKTKDTGMPEPMKLYDVVASKTGTLIPVSEDTRDKSRGVNTPFTPKKKSEGKKSEDINDADDIGF